MLQSRNMFIVLVLVCFFGCFDLSIVMAGGGGVDYTSVAGTPNQFSIGQALNALQDEGGMPGLRSELESLPDAAAVQNAFNQLMPQQGIVVPVITAGAAQKSTGQLFSRLYEARSGQSFAGRGSYASPRLLASTDASFGFDSLAANNRWSPYFKTFGTWADRESDRSLSGYTLTTRGIMAGADTLVNDSFLLGWSIAGARSDVDYAQALSETDIQSLMASLYGSWLVSDYHVDAVLGYGHHWYDGRRTVAFGGINERAKSDYEGDTWSVAIEAGRDFNFRDMVFEPVVGFGYTAVKDRGYREHGGSNVKLNVSANTTESLYSKLGMRISKQFQFAAQPGRIYVPQVRLFWIHDFSDRVEQHAAFAQGGNFAVKGYRPDRDSLNLGTGLSLYLEKGLRLFADYDWQLSSEYSAHHVQAGIQMSF